MIKKILIFIILISAFTTPVSAEGYDIDEIYDNQYHESNLASVEELLDDETKRLVEEFGFVPEDFDSYKNFTISNVFNIIKYLFTDGIKAPLAAFMSILGASVLLGAIRSAEPDNKGFGIADVAGVAIVAVGIIAPAFMLFKSAFAAVKSAAVFMTGFIPIFAGVLISSGRPTTSSLTSASLLISAEVCEQICSFVILPFVGIYLAVSIAASFSDKFNISSVSATIQKTISFCMTAVMSVFSAVLSIQSLISSSVDSLSLRAFRFVAGSTPIIGGAVSEATGVVSTCINTLKNSAVIYAVICFSAILLPVIVEVLLWRAAMFCASMVSNMLGATKISELCNSVGYSFGITTSVMINTFIMFVISLTVIMMTTGNLI